jgi:uncharacterized repeat protein (TIGR01451 family)
MALAITGAPNPITVGNNVTYTITVTDNGPENATGVTVTDVLPAGATFVSSSSSQGTTTVANGVLTGALGGVNNGGSATVTLVLTTTQTGSLSDTATVTADQVDNNLSNNTGTATVNVVSLAQSADLSVTNSGSPNPVYANTPLTYTMVVTNNGPAAATGVKLTDPFPANVTFVSASTTKGTVSHGNGVLTANIGDLANGDSATVTLVVLPNTNAVGTLNDTATVTGDQADQNLGNNSATATVTVNPPAADLALTAATTPANLVTVNTDLTYTFTVTNNGPNNDTGVTLTDPLPAGTTFISASSSQGTVSLGNGTITGNLGEVDAGGNATLTLVLLPTVTGSLSNTASVTGDLPDPNLSNNTATPTVTVVPLSQSADLAITNSGSPNPVEVGHNETFTITVANNGPADATGVTVSDALPSNVTFVSVSSTQGTASVSNGTLTALLGDLAANAQATVTLIVTVNSGGGGTGDTLSDTATVTGDQADPILTNNSATATVTVTQTTGADLVITSSGSPNPVTVGTPLTYTIVVTNNGPENATGVKVTDGLPSSVTFVSVHSSQGTVSHSNGVVTAHLGNIAFGGHATVTIVVTPNVVGSLSDTATVTGTNNSNLNNNTATATVTVVNSNTTGTADLSITNSGSPNPVLVGTPETFTLTVTNNGPDPASGVTVTDGLPTGVSFVSATSSQGTVSVTNGLLTGLLGNLADDATATVTLVVTPTVAGSLSDTASVTGDQIDNNLSNNSATATVNVVTTSQTVDLAITNSGSPNPVDVGQNETFTITVTNHGPAGATGVKVSNPLPAGVTFVSASSSQGTVTHNGSGDVTANLGSLANGASATVTIVVTPTVNAIGTLNDTATVTADQVDTNTNNSATASVTVNPPAADLGVTETATPNPVTVNTELTYVFTITNNGPSGATGVTLTDPLPAGVTFVSASSSKGTTSLANGTLTADIGALANGDHATVTLIVLPTVTGSLSNTATVTGDQTDNNLSNNTVTATVNVESLAQSADLAIAISGSPNPVTIGQNETFTITVTNNGPADATGVTVTDALPSSVTFVSANPSQGTTSVNNGTLTAQLGGLAHGASATVTLVVTVNSGGGSGAGAGNGQSGGTLSDTATVTGDQADPNLTNNTATATVNVVQQTGADLSLSISASPNPDTVGSQLTYTITVTNNGPQDATNVTVTDALPSGLNIQLILTSQGSSSSANGTVTATLGKLKEGATATVTIIVTPTTAGSITNTATVTATESDPNTGNNTASVTVTILPFAGGDPNTAFVTVLYTQILGGDPDPVGLQFWVAELQAGLPRVQVARAFWEGPQHRTEEVTSYFQIYLGRAPDAPGLQFWVSTMLGGMDETQTQLGFIETAEFQAAHQTPDSFTRALFQDILGRNPGSSLAFWASVVGTPPVGPQTAAVDILNSQERFTSIVTNTYTFLLGRSADPGSQTFWVNSLETGQISLDSFYEAVLASDEFFARAASGAFQSSGNSGLAGSAGKAG